MSMNGFEDNVKGLNIYKYFFGMSTIPNTKRLYFFLYIFAFFFFSKQINSNFYSLRLCVDLTAKMVIMYIICTGNWL